MIWVIVVLLTSFTGETVEITLERSYESLSDCSHTLVVLREAVEDYWPNPKAGVKQIEFSCQTQRPYGD